MLRAYIGGQEAATPDEFVELALGTPAELWLGPDEGESDEERAARLDAARDILADDPGLPERVRQGPDLPAGVRAPKLYQAVAAAIETQAEHMFDVVPLARRRRPAAAGRRRTQRRAA